MAERRMFAKTIIDSDAFIDMPLSTQALYFHLSMRADDEGFINSPKKIQRMVGATEDDLKLLIAKNFIIPFESGVVVIKHWKIHNYIRKDRITETVYQEEKKQLIEKENGAYTFSKFDLLESEEIEDTPRQIAYKESSLPYSFNYKIKRAFEGKQCPICKKKMTSSSKMSTPTVQHNVPISKGGEHEIENISVICLSCNTSIQNEETDNLNNKEVVETWDKINYLEKKGVDWFWDLSKLDECQSDDGQMSAQVRLGKVSIGKDNNIRKFTKPSLDELTTYITENNLNVDAQTFMDYYDSNGWKVGGKASMKDWKATCRRWSRTNSKQSKPSWMDKEIKKENISDEEINELENLMKDFK